MIHFQMLPLPQRRQEQRKNHQQKFGLLLRLLRKVRRSRNLLRSGLCLNLIISRTAGSQIYGREVIAVVTVG